MNQKKILTEQYADFISNIYLYDKDNLEEYKKVDGLLDAMYQIYKSWNTKDFFLMECIIKEINTITKK